MNIRRYHRDRSKFLNYGLVSLVGVRIYECVSVCARVRVCVCHAANSN